MHISTQQRRQIFWGSFRIIFFIFYPPPSTQINFEFLSSEKRIFFFFIFTKLEKRRERGERETGEENFEKMNPKNMVFFSL